MKVLFDYLAFSGSKYGGIPRYCATLYHHLPKAGIEVELALRFAPNAYLKGEFPPLIDRNTWHWANRKMNKINKAHSQRRIFCGKYDILHPTFIHPYVLGDINNRPLVVTVHDMIRQRMADSFPGQPDVRWQETVFARADKFIAISQFTKADLLDYYPWIDPAKVEVVHHGLDFARERKEPALPLEPFSYILFGGERHEPRKQFPYFIQEAVPVAKKYGLKIVCTGGGPFTGEQTLALAAAGAPQGMALQFGATDAELAWLYENAACFVYPSIYEGFGLPILEAFHTRCPLILANATCFPEVAGDAALYFEPRREGALKDALCKLLDDSAMRDSLTNRAETRAKDFSLNAMIEKTASIYRSML